MNSHQGCVWCSLIVQMAVGLQKLHALGVAHQDLKLGNVSATNWAWMLLLCKPSPNELKVL